MWSGRFCLMLLCNHEVASCNCLVAARLQGKQLQRKPARLSLERDSQNLLTGLVE